MQITESKNIRGYDEFTTCGAAEVPADSIIIAMHLHGVTILTSVSMLSVYQHNFLES